ncbi:hypothetical protein [Streptomyces colonosanans]|uniref:Uncharacterized protein n=1 Tax=Streptomyces colonosanans TaxID=1428652 RepID=A0A1S2Q735_9ACTN|nr:hypothetical protein [Streptomyces colonosanans]OIK01356.1 hypothetical protein BIV24_00970 [Streptomyces colonosanans]
MPEALPADMALVLNAVLGKDGPVHLALREQSPYLRVRERCTCGCGTAYFDLDTGEVEPAPSGPGTVVAADARIHTKAGDCAGEVLVFAEGGCLSRLEVCSWSDDTEVTLTSAQRSLRPLHHGHLGLAPVPDIRGTTSSQRISRPLDQASVTDGQS